MSEQTFRILSLDGGGVRGVMAAVWLNELEKQLSAPLHRYFDLIAGTSTGSVIGAVIALGVDCEHIIDMYHQRSSQIFPSEAHGLWHKASRLFSEGISRPIYSEEGMAEVFKEVFADQVLGDVKTPLLVPSYDLLGCHNIIFKSWKPHHAELSLWEICKASASAPTYFPAHVMQMGRVKLPLVDGGLIANNPSMCAVTEALKINSRCGDEGLGLNNFMVASFSTGEYVNSISLEDGREWGPLEWAKNLVDVMFNASSTAIDHWAETLIPDKQYYRFKLRLEEKEAEMDNADEAVINALMVKAQHYIRTGSGKKKLDKLVACLESEGERSDTNNFSACFLPQSDDA